MRMRETQGAQGRGRNAPPFLRTILAYIALTKPRVIELLLVTTIPAMLLADRGDVNPLLILNTLLGGVMAAASANTLVRRRRRYRQGDEAHRAAAAGHVLGDHP